MITCSHTIHYPSTRIALALALAHLSTSSPSLSLSSRPPHISPPLPSPHTPHFRRPPLPPPHQFESAMVALNFVGMHKEVHGLFDRFDIDGNESLDYAEFCEAMVGERKDIHSDAKDIVSRVKALITARGGANGIRSMARVLRQLDDNGNRKIEPVELKDGLAVVGIATSEAEIAKLMLYFDRDGSGSIDITEFLRGLRGRMARRRVQLVKEAFDRFDKTGDGVVAIDDLRSTYEQDETRVCVG